MTAFSHMPQTLGAPGEVNVTPMATSKNGSLYAPSWRNEISRTSYGGMVRLLSNGATSKPGALAAGAPTAGRMQQSVMGAGRFGR